MSAPGIFAAATLVLVAASGLPLPGSAQVFRGPDGQASPPSAARGEVDGLSAMLLATGDPDWQAKWNTPPEVVPDLRETHRIGPGGTLAILVFFAGLKVQDGAVDATLDLRIVQPDGVDQANLADLPCARGPLQGHPRYVRLCEASIRFEATPRDPVGTYVVEAVLHDRLDGRSLSLRREFVVEAIVE